MIFPNTKAALALLVLLAVGGCTTKSSLYCDAANPCSDPTLPFCDLTGRFGPARTCLAATTDAGVQLCLGSSTCDASTPICDTPTGICRGCGSDAECSARDPATRLCIASRCISCRTDSECSGTSPICEDGLCRKCRADAECASLVCYPQTGSCVEESQVIYMGKTNCVAGLGLRSRPVCTVKQAWDLVTSDRFHVQIATGDYATNTTLATKRMVLVGSDNAQLVGMQHDQPVLAVTDGADVTLRRMVIRGGDGPNGHGVGCFHSPPNTSHLTVEDTKIERNQGKGIFGDACVLSMLRGFIANNGGDGLLLLTSRATLSKSQIVENGLAGIWADNSTLVLAQSSVSKSRDSGVVATNHSVLDLASSLITGNRMQPGVGVYGSSSATIDACTVSKNATGGISIRNSDFAVTNTFLVENGSATSILAAFDSSGAGVARTRKFVNNTVANNRSSTSVASALRCDPSFDALNTIVWGHANTTVHTGCIFSFSDVQGSTAGNDNRNQDPLFVDAGAGDFHLSPSSPLRDQGTSLMAPDHDVDGHSRPTGPGVDIGADEL